MDEENKGEVDPYAANSFDKYAPDFKPGRPKSNSVGSKGVKAKSRYQDTRSNSDFPEKAKKN